VKPVLSRAEVRELDRRATAEAGIPSLELMERAGRGATELLFARFPEARCVVVACGAGNNGGDGFVVARRLRDAGRDARVVFVGDLARLRGDALANHQVFVAAGGSVSTVDEQSSAALEQALTAADLVVDALFGTGLDRDLAGIFRTVIERLNATALPKLALDLPSGIDADTGMPHGLALHADVTATFAATKRGLTTPSGAAHAGEVVVVSLGIPAELEQRLGYAAEELEDADVAPAIARRGPGSHKGSSGRVLVIAGSPGKVGAGLLCAEGALRAGAGLVTLVGVPETVAVYENRVLEAMTARLDASRLEESLDALLEHADAVALGPGLGLDPPARRIVEHVALRWPGRVVLDADALTCFGDRAGELARSRGELVLTPHPGEMGRLLGSSAAAVESDRYRAVTRAAELSGQTVLLKGASTLIAAPGRRVAVNPTGHPILATGGAGDVLSGVIAALLVAADPYRAACAGAYVHGRAASELAALRRVDRGVLAHEIAGAVPHALGSLNVRR